MSDIITRILLKTNDFDANLNKSKQSVNSFQSGISSATQTAGAGIAKFAGAIGLAVGAGEAFMKTIRSSQATNDAFDNNMNACKDSVDAFFSSLATGDFSAFEGGLLNLFDRARDLSSALDDIADKRLSIDLVDLRKQGEMTALEAIIRDTSKTKKERSDALAKYQALAKEVAANRLDIAKEELTGNTNVELNKIGVKNLSQDDVTLYLEKLNNKDLNQQFLKELKYVSDYTKSYNEAWKKVAAYRNRNGADEKSFQMERDFNEQYETPDKWMKRAFPKSEFRDSKQLIDFGKLFQQGDNGRMALYEYTRKLYEAENQNAADVRKLTKLKNSTNAASGGTGGGKATTEDAPLSGSLAYFDAEIAKKNKELISAIDAQARSAIQSTISELEKQKIELLITGKDGSLEALSIQISSLKSKYISATTDEAREEIQKLITDLESKMSYINGKAKAPLKKAGLPTQGYDTKKINPFKTKSPISKKDIKLNEEYNESLAAMGSIMGSLSGAFDGSTQSVLQWGITLLTTIGQAIPAIASMIPAKKQDAAASKEKASASMLAAGAETMEAHAGIPFAGIAIGLAGVASIIAVLSSMPKFATGGVVPGVSFTGDKVPAWLNSGEMILNGGQQANLFRMLNAGLYAGITAEQVQPNMGNVSRFIMPDESAREIVISGTLRANGSVLETVLNNYTHKKSKVR